MTTSLSAVTPRAALCRVVATVVAGGAAAVQADTFLAGHAMPRRAGRGLQQLADSGASPPGSSPTAPAAPSTSASSLGLGIGLSVGITLLGLAAIAWAIVAVCRCAHRRGAPTLPASAPTA